MATLTSKPMFFIVPGAWHPPSAYRQLAASLEALGHSTTVASIPSLNPKSVETATCTEDAKALQKQLLSIIDGDGLEVVVLAHSAGGIPAGGAAYGLSKTTRAEEGKKGGVLGLIYMTAFVVPEGASLVDYLGGKHAPYFVADQVCFSISVSAQTPRHRDGFTDHFFSIIQPSEGLCVASPAIETFYNDVEKDTAESLAASLLPHAMLAFSSPAPASAWAQPAFQGKLAFVKCLKDNALPPFLQDMFVERSGVKWAIKEVDTGHSPWVSKPKETAEIMVDLVEGFSK